MKINDNQYWLGDETSLRNHLSIEQKIHSTPTAELQDMAIRAMTEYEDDSAVEFGEFNYMVSRADNVAIVTISGSLTTSNRPYNRYIGMVSYDEIRNAVFAAIDTDGIDGIVLNMDTPGGQASGISELSDFLSEVNSNIKPIYTYTGTAMASGGYWLGSLGREIYAAKLATVGSIGVITVHTSLSEMYKKEGIEITVLRAGEFKALGSPYEKLDDKARDQIQSQMNTIYDVFLETVAENRGTSVNSLKETAAEGRVFIGADSVTVGLVDRISSFDAAIAEISRKVRSNETRVLSQPRSETIVGEIDMPGKKKVLTEAGVAAIESGVPEADVLADPNMVAEVEDEGTPAGEPAAEEGTEGSEVTAEGAGEEASAGSGAEATLEVKQEDQGALINNMFDRITSLTTEKANLTAKLASAEQDRDAAKSTETALTKIAVTAINRMQVSLGGTPTKMDDASPSVVLDQYNRTYSQFNQKFKVGSTAQVPESEDFEDREGGNVENSSMSAAVQRLTSSKVK